MGLISGLLTLPLAPVRGTAWIAEMILAQAESEQNDESSIMAALQEVEIARAEGELSDAEAAEVENSLLERLMATRGFAGEEHHGRIE